MAVFLLRLPSEMRDHLIAKDFKDSTLVAEYAGLAATQQPGQLILDAVNPEYVETIIAVSRNRSFSPRI
jgi:hypothetical protein